MSLIISLVISFSFLWAQEKKAEGLAPTSLYGDATLVSNSVEKGITQTMSDPALQATFGYRWTYFRVGIWGSNVRFAGLNDHFNLRYFASYQFVWTANADMTVRYDFNNYYSSGSRNGNVSSLQVNLLGYGILYEQNSNWEGRGSTTTYFAVKRSWPIPYNLSWENQLGYSMISASGFNNYLDYRTSVSYLLAQVTYFLGGTLVSDSSQLGDRAGLFIFLGLKASL